MDSLPAWLPPLSSTNAVDWLLVVIVLLGALGGWRRGFVAATLQLLTLAASLTVALAGYVQPAAWLQAQFPALGDWAPPLAFLSIFALLYAALASLAGRAIGALPRTAHAHVGNRLLGLAPGVVTGLINAVVVAVLLLAIALWMLWHVPRRGVDPVQAAYARFCARLARRGLVRAPNEGPADFAQRAAEARPDLAEAIGRITDLYVRLRYGPEPAGVEMLRRAVREFRP